MPLIPFRRLLSRWSLVLVTSGAVVLGGWFLPSDGFSQAPVTSTSNAALNALLTKFKAQQDQLAANQTKIEAQTAQLAEQLRQAKIYTARAGAGRR